MATETSHSRRRKRKHAAEPALTKLLDQLHNWLEEEESVCVLSSAAEAARRVAQQQLLATYHESYHGWRRWHRRALECSSLQTLREQVLQEVAQAVREQETAEEQTQLARLGIMDSNNNSTPQLPHPDVVHLLQQLQPVANMRPNRQKANRLAQQLWPMIEHDTGKDAPALDFLWIDESTGRLWNEDVVHEKEQDSSKGLARLIFRLWQCASQGIRAISLSLRVTEASRLHQVCRALDEHYRMSAEICPADQWCAGPPSQRANVETTDNVGDELDAIIRDNRLPYGQDRRYYLIVGTPGALTKSHWDRGVQTVLYHTVAGTNHALAVPRKLALMLQAVNEAVNERMRRSADDASALAGWADELELQALQACQVRAGTFGPGETMLILPGGGHAVLTGDNGKVVLAGEWHLRTDIH